MKNKSGIYCIENLINHKKYIGQSKNIKRRLSDHLSELRNNKHFNDHLQRSWNTYGQKNFNISILCYCPENELDKRETYYIDLYKTMNKDFGYNKDSGGNKCKTRNEEARDKMRLYWAEHGGINDGLLQATKKAKKPVVQYLQDGSFLPSLIRLWTHTNQQVLDLNRFQRLVMGLTKPPVDLFGGLKRTILINLR